jgi:hypothetical protein
MSTNPQIRSNARQNKILTGIAHGYSQAELIGTKVLPIVTETQKNIEVPIFPNDAFHSVDSIRTPGGDPARTTTDKHTTKTVQLVEHSLGDYVDRLEVEDGDTYKLKVRKTKNTLGKILNAQEARIEAKVNDYDSYGANNKETLTDSDQWTHADSDPRAQILDALSTGQKQLGVLFNTLTLGQEAWNALMQNANLIKFIKDANLGLTNMETIKKVFGIQNIFVGSGVKTVNGTNSFIWGDNAVLSYTTTNRNPSKFDPSFGFTFQRKGHPYVKEAPDPRGNYTNIDVYLQSAEEVISYDAAFMFKDTNA